MISSLGRATALASDWVVLSYIRSVDDHWTQVHITNNRDQGIPFPYKAAVFFPKGEVQRVNGHRPFHLYKYNRKIYTYTHTCTPGCYCCEVPVVDAAAVPVEWLEWDCLFFSGRLTASHLHSEGFKREVYLKDRKELEEWATTQDEGEGLDRAV